jgi:hypothetical protein
VVSEPQLKHFLVPHQALLLPYLAGHGDWQRFAGYIPRYNV